MHDHFTVNSTEGDCRHTRTVIAANERDAKQTHREHYPAFMVTTVVANGKRRSWRRLRTRPTRPAGIAASAAAPVFGGASSEPPHAASVRMSIVSRPAVAALVAPEVDVISEER